jgi:hypothetical protein
MNNLDELGGYKDTIIDLFVKDQDIVDLVLPNPVAGYDVTTQLLGSETIKNPDGTLMFEGHIFPFFYTDGTNKKARTFLLVEDKVNRVDENGMFKSVKLFIYAFTENSLAKLTNKEKAKYKLKGYKGSCRTDVLSTAIDNLLNKSTIFGLRDLKLDGVDIFKPTTNSYYGRVITYTATCENTGGDDCGR